MSILDAQIHKDGRIWGYRALIGYQRISEYHRRAPIVPDPTNPSNNTGLAGAFGYLLGHHPQLQQFIDDLYLKRKRGHSRIIHETKITTERLHKRFLDECRRLGIKEDEYPFTQREQGLRSLYEYIRTLKETNMIAAVRARGRKEDAQLLNDIGTGPSPIRPTRPFQSIEFDGHHLDMHMTIEIPSPHGSQFVLIKRIWLLVILDLYSEAVLGYHISLNFEYNRYDILRCILYALTPPPVAPQIIEDLSFPQNGRVPNDVFPELHWTAWDEQKLDNAMAHRATVAQAIIAKTVGASILKGKPRIPTKRPYVERFFGLLEEHSFHRIPGTSGSNTSDPRGHGGQEFAKKHAITLDMIRQLLDIAMAEYNHAPRYPLFAHTPMEAISNYIKMNPDAVLRKLPPDTQCAGAILADRVVVTVKGNILNGRRPYINYKYARYTSDILARSPNLIGEKLTLIVNPDDLRVVRAYLSGGGELGYLTAKGAWGRIPHNSEMRTTIHKLMKENKINVPEGKDPVEVFLRYLEKRASLSRRAASQWAQAAGVSPESIPQQKPSSSESEDTKPVDLGSLERTQKTLQ